MRGIGREVIRKVVRKVIGEIIREVVVRKIVTAFFGALATAPIVVDVRKVVWKVVGEVVREVVVRDIITANLGSLSAVPMMVTTATFLIFLISLIFIIMTFGCLLGSLPCCLCCLRGCLLDIFWLLRVTIFNFFCIFVVICIFWVTTSTALAVWVGEALLTVPHPLFHVFLLRSWRRLRILLAHVALNLIILIGRKMVMDFGRTICMIVIIVVVNILFTSTALLLVTTSTAAVLIFVVVIVVDMRGIGREVIRKVVRKVIGEIIREVVVRKIVTAFFGALATAPIVVDVRKVVWKVVRKIFVVNWIATLCCCLFHLLLYFLCRSCCFPSRLGCFWANIACVSAMVTMSVRQRFLLVFRMLSHISRLLSYLSRLSSCSCSLFGIVMISNACRTLRFRRLLHRSTMCDFELSPINATISVLVSMLKTHFHLF